ncbi:MAG TPA: hypothetical protein VKV19_12330 [Ktedonobacteraceae bacterium]|nr:hypothetical protein [Ktedonobacteraceae bacterium]
MKMPEICHRGHDQSALSRFTGERPLYTNRVIRCSCWQMQRAVRRASRLITQWEAHAEAGQGTLKRPSMARFG